MVEYFHCPHCHRTSYYAEDIKNHYCAFCNHYCDGPEEDNDGR